MPNEYAEELNKEIELLKEQNPFNNDSQVIITDNENKNNGKHTPEKKDFYEEKTKSKNYFSLILDSDYQDIELEIRGLRYVTYRDEKTGKKIVELEKKKNHYLSSSGAEYLLGTLRMNTATDLKLGLIKEDEFKQTMDIFTKNFIRFMKENLEVLGMDTEEKQRKGVVLTISIINRVRSVFSRSIGGAENKRSHGDIHLSGGLDMDREERFNLEEARN